MTVGFEQPLRLEIPADRQETFRRRMLNGGKGEIARISAQPDHG
jgi:hypothetical protein